jgi:hypothetical protein
MNIFEPIGSKISKTQNSELKLKTFRAGWPQRFCGG